MSKKDNKNANEPPPTAVVMPIMATPNRSICFFTARAAPEMAKATAPINSK